LLDECLVLLCKVPGGQRAPEDQKERTAIQFAPWFEMMAGEEEDDEVPEPSKSVNAPVEQTFP
jgi:hypothetical protein